MEKLIIKDFCGIKNIQIDLADITVLIGPQASGKSICAKSLYFFKRFVIEMRTALEEQKNKKDFDEALRLKFEEYFPPQSWTPNFLLRYEFEGTEGKKLFIQVKKASTLKISYSAIFKTIFEESKKEHKRIFSANTSISEGTQIDYRLSFEFDRAYRAILRNHLGNDGQIQLFIPAGRSFFGILQSNIFSFLATNTATIDPLFKSFGSFYENVKSNEKRGYPIRGKSKKEEKFLNLVKKVEALVNNILKGNYVSERGRDFIVSQDGRKTSVNNASSGQQETLPLTLILKNLLHRAHNIPRGITVYIEEPEAHIFPAAQKQIVQLIAFVFNASKENAPYQFLITTHSPYILTSLNNLLLSGKLMKKLKGEKKKTLLSIIDSDSALTIENMNCYTLKDGISTPIISREDELIESQVIDEVSDELSNEFGKLLELEYH